ncbi:hypothetical protein [Halospeciosus flavus]|uniref:hypothetical protein n=1 Tax=Halospeciosus flavus TaxID=3032283 RepID=UPI003607D1EA
MPGDSEGNAFVSFSTTATGTEIRVRDGVGTHEYTLQTDVPVSLERASPDRFISPVDTAVSFTTSELHLPPIARSSSATGTVSTSVNSGPNHGSSFEGPTTPRSRRR